MTEKSFSKSVDIKIYDKKGNLLMSSEAQQIFQYFHLYVGKLTSDIDYVYVKVAESDSKNILFSKFMKIHK